MIGIATSANIRRTGTATTCPAFQVTRKMYPAIRPGDRVIAFPMTGKCAEFPLSETFHRWETAIPDTCNIAIPPPPFQEYPSIAEPVLQLRIKKRGRLIPR
jgi:hypothetical protein